MISLVTCPTKFAPRWKTTRAIPRTPTTILPTCRVGGAQYPEYKVEDVSLQTTVRGRRALPVPGAVVRGLSGITRSVSVTKHKRLPKYGRLLARDT